MSEIRELVRRFGSPLYLYDLGRVSRALTDLRTALPQPSTLYYSLKANPHPDVVRQLRGHGCLAEVSSRGELDAAGDAGFVGGEYLYTGPAKTVDEVAYAMTRGVRRFSAESVEDVRRIARAAGRTAVTADCLVRIDAGPAGASGLRMTGAASQFGMALAEMRTERDRLLSEPSVSIVGVHLFPISNARSEESLIAELLDAVTLAARVRDELGISLAEVNLGGGFAAPFARPGRRPVYRRLRSELEPALDACLPGWREQRPRIGFESGRYLVADCGTLVSAVTEVKHSRGRTFVLLESGINHLGGMAGLGRLLPPSVALDSGPVAAPGPSTGTGTLVGPLCTAADVLGREIAVDGLRAGDIVAVPNVGAYGLTASLLAFLSRPAPREVTTQGSTVVSVSQLQLHRIDVEPPVSADRAWS